MIDLFYAPTPNGWKISIFLEEAGLAYTVRPVNIGRGEQFAPDFLAISPNNRIPAIVDNDPAGGGPPVSVFESGAILLYLAEKTGQFLPTDLRGRTATLEWLMWQMGGLGPMLGQNGHFRLYAPEPIPYAIDRRTCGRGGLHRRRHGHLPLGGDPQGPGPEPRRLSRGKDLVRQGAGPARGPGRHGCGARDPAGRDGP
jgi:hypothetical protein